MFGSRNFLFAKASAIAAQFKLFSWGHNNRGELGLGNQVTYSSPKQVGALVDWAYPSIGGGGNSSYQTTLCTKTDGTLWAWGYNNYGQLGQNNTVSRSSPIQVGALATWGKPTVTGRAAVLCIKTDGTLWSWGSGYRGNTAQGNEINRSSPTQVGALTNWSNLAQVNNTNVLCAKTDGTLWSWGNNKYGELGLGYAATYPTPGFTIRSPKQVGALTDWANPSAGNYFALCVKTNGTLWTWGLNGNGQLGLGDIVSRSSPVQVGALTTWSKPTGGQQFSGCSKTDGTLWMWGRNQSGQLGHGNTVNLSSPVQVGALTTWSYAMAGWTHTAAVKTNGQLWVWGANGNGRLGLGDTVNRSSPVQVGALTNWVNVTASVSSTLCTQGVATSAPISLTLPIVTGIAQEGEILSSTTGTWDQFPSSFAFQWQRGTSNIGGATSSTYEIVAADVGSTLRCVVTATNSIGATAANSANTATVIAYVGKLFSWGNNSTGVLGTGPAGGYNGASSPIQIGAETLWSSKRAGNNFVLAVKTNGQLWAWGRNGNGQLGIGNTSYRSSPVQVGALTDWATPGTGGGNSGCCVKTDGTLWTWGYNNFGQLGHGNTTNYSSPKQVGALTNWKTPLVGSGGIFFLLCAKTDGTLWSWGKNDYGQLGLGNKTDYSSPKQVGALTNWKTPVGGITTNNSWVVCSKTDGTLWSWGRNNQGQLGTNNLTDYSSPKQIGALTNWVTPVAGTVFTLCTKTDGTLWSWGYNGFGQLGLGSSFPGGISSPSQVGTLTNWKTPAAGSGISSCVKTDGTLWSWGNNDLGALGQNNTIRRSSPIQVGALTTWLVPSGTGYGFNCTQR